MVVMYLCVCNLEAGRDKVGVTHWQLLLSEHNENYFGLLLLKWTPASKLYAD